MFISCKDHVCRIHTCSKFLMNFARYSGTRSQFGKGTMKWFSSPHRRWVIKVQSCYQVIRLKKGKHTFKFVINVVTIWFQDVCYKWSNHTDFMRERERAWMCKQREREIERNKTCMAWPSGITKWMTPEAGSNSGMHIFMTSTSAYGLSASTWEPSATKNRRSLHGVSANNFEGSCSFCKVQLRERKWNHVFPNDVRI